MTRPVRAQQVKLAAASGGQPGLPEAIAASQSALADWPQDLVELGYIMDAYGIRGWIKVQPHAAHGEALLTARRWWLRRAVPDTAPASQVEIVRSREHSGTVVAQVKGVADRNAAEALKGWQVWVPRSAFPAPEADEFYWVDLIGTQVSNLQGELLGTVSGLIDNGAHAVLRVAYEVLDEAPDASGAARQHERLIPFVGEYVKEVDTAGRRIVADWGLDY